MWSRLIGGATFLCLWMLGVCTLDAWGVHVFRQRASFKIYDLGKRENHGLAAEICARLTRCGDCGDRPTRARATRCGRVPGAERRGYGGLAGAMACGSILGLSYSSAQCRCRQEAVSCCVLVHGGACREFMRDRDHHPEERWGTYCRDADRSSVSGRDGRRARIGRSVFARRPLRRCDAGAADRLRRERRGGRVHRGWVAHRLVCACCGCVRALLGRCVPCVLIHHK